VAKREPHVVLGVEPTASPTQIKAAWRKLARQHHPDLTGDDPAASRVATRQMAEINEAYAILRNPDKRRKYDEWLASRRDRRRHDRVSIDPGSIPFGEAGTPQGPPHGSVVDFGRYQGWTLGQIKRHDPEFLEWLMRAPAGHRFRAEISQMLAARSAR